VDGLSFDFDSIRKYPNLVDLKCDRMKVSDRHFLSVGDKKRRWIFDELILRTGQRSSVVKVYYNDDSPLRIFCEEGKLFIKKVAAGAIFDVRVEPIPLLSYTKKQHQGVQLDDFVSVMGVDRLGVLTFDGCEEWSKGLPCHFCGANPNRLGYCQKKPNLGQLGHFPDYDSWWNSYEDFFREGVATAIREIMNEDIEPHRHFLAMSGNLSDQDKAWQYLLRVLGEMSRVIDFSEWDSHINLLPPRDFRYIHMAKDLGFKNICMNLEVFDPGLFALICPGKHLACGYGRIREALDYSLGVFGGGNVRTNLVLGAEPVANLIRASKELGERGIVVNTTVFYPRPGSVWRNKKPPTKEEVLEATGRLTETHRAYGHTPFGCTLSSRSSLESEFFDA
jgi:hypothetical protein